MFTGVLSDHTLTSNSTDGRKRYGDDVSDVLILTSTGPKSISIAFAGEHWEAPQGKATIEWPKMQWPTVELPFGWFASVCVVVPLAISLCRYLDSRKSILS